MSLTQAETSEYGPRTTHMVYRDISFSDNLGMVMLTADNNGAYWNSAVAKASYMTAYTWIARGTETVAHTKDKRAASFR